MENIAKLLNKETTTVIDVRSQWEYEEEHWPGAVLIPLEEVVLRAPEIRQMPGAKLLYCRSGNRSGMAQRLLQHLGVTEVHNAGGLYDLQMLQNRHQYV
jgi:phage shock protein E